jgi:hypothetical protein
MDGASRQVLRGAFLETVSQQLQNGDPPETREAFERLKGMGYSEPAAKKLLAAVVAAEVWRVMKHRRPFNVEAFVRDLAALPKLPES